MNPISAPSKSDPYSPARVAYNPTRGEATQSNKANLTEWWSTATGAIHRSDKFATVAECPNLSDIGHTRKKSDLHAYDKGWYTQHQLDAGFVTAPQFYKNASDYSKFPLRPREQQVLYAGNDIMPIPQAPRTFWRGEEASANTLKETVFVRRFHISPEELRTQIQARYWPKKQVPKPRDDWWRGMMRRMVSSFAGGGIDKNEGVWMPKGELYMNENRIQGPAEALQIWDATMNPGMTRSGSRGGFATEPATYATENLRKKFEEKV